MLFKDYCENYREEPVPQLKFYEEIRNYEKTECPDERKKLAKSIYDNFIMREMLSHTHVSYYRNMWRWPPITMSIITGILQRVRGPR